MKHLFLVAVILFAAAVQGFGQAKTRRLSSSINHPSINLYYPFISADANALLFISDNAEDNALTPFFTVREVTDWREPQLLPKHIHTRLNFLKGYSLSADGSVLYYSTMKGPSVGGFDIWSATAKGSGWAEPVNPGMPINSKLHEACPSVTTDGNTMYFMRCEQMDQNSASNCKIFKISKKATGQWDEAIELPAHINTGNSQTPRIMADGETLIFSSNRITPNKGGMDLYLTRLSNGEWSKPVPLDFANTEKDDQYVSVSGLGRYLLKDTQGTRKNELVEFLIPENLRPKAMTKVEGTVKDENGNPIAAYISVNDLGNGNKFYSGRPDATGSFLLYLKEGTSYELSIDPEHNHVTYFSKVYDMTGDKIPQSEKVDAILKPLSVGDQLELDLVSFKPYDSELDLASSSNELKRLVRVINANPDKKFEIQVLLSGLLEDTVQSDPDLTEVVYDSVEYEYEAMDSLGNTIHEDTIMVETRYHNDRTWKQAESIVQYLISQGVSGDRLSVFGNAIPATLPENRRLSIKVAVRAKG